MDKIVVDCLSLSHELTIRVCVLIFNRDKRYHIKFSEMI